MFLSDPCCWGYIKFLPEKFLRNQIWKEFCQAQARLRPTAACETACSAKKEELSYKKFDIDPPAVKLPGRQRADPPAVKLPGRQRADPPAAMCPRAESGSANLLIQQTLRQESCRRVCYVLYDCLASFSFSGMNQHHACKEDNDSAGDNEKNSDTILLFLGESAGLIGVRSAPIMTSLVSTV